MPIRGFVSGEICVRAYENAVLSWELLLLQCIFSALNYSGVFKIVRRVSLNDAVRRDLRLQWRCKRLAQERIMGRVLYLDDDVQLADLLSRRL